MAGVFRLAFRRIAPRGQSPSAQDWRWSLGASDPSAGLISGTFSASDGAQIPYRIWPAAEPRALVLLLHGAFDYSGAFDEIGPRLAQRGFTALAIDQRGFGATRSRRQWCGIERMIGDVEDAVGFLRVRYGSRPVFILGESMGADVAIQAAAAKPNVDLAGLVLAAPGAVSDAMRRMVWGFLIKLLRVVAPNGEVKIERLSGQEFTAAGAIRLLCDPLVLRSVRPAMAAGLFDLAVSTVSAARQVRVPALTMIGSREDFLYAKCIEHLHGALAGLKSWRVFEGGPHLLLHWRRAETVLEALVDWIDAQLDEPGSARHSRPAAS